MSGLKTISFAIGLGGLVVFGVVNWWAPMGTGGLVIAAILVGIMLTALAIG